MFNDFYEKRGNGYCGHSMSNNAVDAYSRGEKPMSEWTKSEILDLIEDEYPDLYELAKKVCASDLKLYFLDLTSWHHTGKYYRRTDFYSFDYDVDYDKAFLENLIYEHKKELAARKESKPEIIKYRGNFTYLEWSGTRKHPRATEIRLENVNIEERGCFYIVTDENDNFIIRKKIDSNGTYAISNEELERIAKTRYINKYMPIAEDLLEKWKSNYEVSDSGHIYADGRKAPYYAYSNGSTDFYKVGERRIAKVKTIEGFDVITTYSAEEWNGNKWISIE